MRSKHPSRLFRERRRPSRVRLPMDAIRTTLAEVAAGVRALRIQLDALLGPADGLPWRDPSRNDKQVA